MVITILIIRPQIIYNIKLSLNKVITGKGNIQPQLSVGSHPILDCKCLKGPRAVNGPRWGGGEAAVTIRKVYGGEANTRPNSCDNQAGGWSGLVVGQAAVMARVVDGRG